MKHEIRKSKYHYQWEKIKKVTGLMNSVLNLMLKRWKNLIVWEQKDNYVKKIGKQGIVKQINFEDNEIVWLQVKLKMKWKS